MRNPSEPPPLHLLMMLLICTQIWTQAFHCGSGVDDRCEDFLVCSIAQRHVLTTCFVRVVHPALSLYFSVMQEYQAVSRRPLAVTNEMWEMASLPFCTEGLSLRAERTRSTACRANCRRYPDDSLASPRSCGSHRVLLVQRSGGFYTWKAPSNVLLRAGTDVPMTWTADNVLGITPTTSSPSFSRPGWQTFYKFTDGGLLLPTHCAPHVGAHRTSFGAIPAWFDGFDAQCFRVLLLRTPV